MSYEMKKVGYNDLTPLILKNLSNTIAMQPSYKDAFQISITNYNQYKQLVWTATVDCVIYIRGLADIDTSYYIMPPEWVEGGTACQTKNAFGSCVFILKKGDRLMHEGNKNSTINFEWCDLYVIPLVPNTITEKYSTQEVVVGEWVDGKPLYRKTFTFTTVNSVSSINFYPLISDIDYCRVINCQETGNYRDYTYFGSNNLDLLKYDDAFSYRVNNNNVTNKEFIVTVEYTKKVTNSEV